MEDEDSAEELEDTDDYESPSPDNESVEEEVQFLVYVYSLRKARGPQFDQDFQVYFNFSLIRVASASNTPTNQTTDGERGYTTGFH